MAWEQYYVGLTPADIALGSNDPVPMRDGSTIWTIGEDAEYARKLPKRVSDTALWQHGASDLLMARSRQLPIFCSNRTGWSVTILVAGENRSQEF